VGSPCLAGRPWRKPEAGRRCLSPQFDRNIIATPLPAANRFVEIGVRPAGGGTFTTLAPRQQVSSSPYAIRTLSAATADALSNTGRVERGAAMSTSLAICHLRPLRAMGSDR
jgi:hypothetical protein